MHYVRLGSVIVGLLRAMMKGRACTEHEDGTIAALLNEDAMRHWKLASTRVDLRVRRLRAY